MIDKIKIYFGNIPKDSIGGPKVKLLRMAQYFENCSEDYDILYALYGHIALEEIFKAKENGKKVVQHVNSFYFKAYRPNYEKLNEGIRKIYELADGIVFGSHFAKNSFYRFFGNRNLPSDIIYNSVDTDFFKPDKIPHDSFNILCIGNHYVRHRIEPIIRAMPMINKMIKKTKLIIAGPLSKGEGIFNCDKEDFIRLAQTLNVSNIEYIPAFTQKESVSIYNSSDVLLHLKYMDWTPNTIAEAMSCGLPVICQGNGGMKEIVEDAGLVFDMADDWNKIHYPEPTEITEKIINIIPLKDKFSELARKKAKEKYDMKLWTNKHKEFFNQFI